MTRDRRSLRALAARVLAVVFLVATAVPASVATRASMMA
jgi:hypothetical protein